MSKDIKALELAKTLIGLAEKHGNNPVKISILGNSDNLELPIHSIENWGTVINIEFSMDGKDWSSKRFKKEIKKIDDWK